ncbi:transcriptional regulator [Streptacidiphilus sp. PB12-B1b]|uniref:ScbA/BarX family gamma-butyrolactone biosynthesis protein n=1 Tax=Streptacidiphilus sp. PB12-B1b TaxID=2705012 RepID=UPI0015FC4512|nr:ScbA/BarX family gamma-butyrolactone biosynthesis protein [Streptacidiphilus sp. PB12-B1b]QMU77269.1 transcriptional regulator [Streptacidiphilus sp. PB12-B1b]
MPSAPQLAFQPTEFTMIPKEVVHKDAAGEVLLRELRHTGADQYVVTARWPSDHHFYLARGGLYDPLLLTESIRQCLPLLSHAAYGVPREHPLLWETYSYRLHPQALRIDGLDPEVRLEIACPEVVRRGARTAALTLQIRAFRGAIPLATARTRFTIQTPAVYQRLRAGQGDAARAMAGALPLLQPVPPGLTGRDHFHDVVLAPTDAPDHWQLRIDTAHPILFDHPVDHAPGMLLLEAARQAAQALAHPRPVLPAAMDVVFTRYVELDRPCWIQAAPLSEDPDGAPRVRVALGHDDDPAFRAAVTLAPLP